MSAIRIEVEKVTTKRVVKKSTGEVFDIPEVIAYVHGVFKHPQAIQFGVPKDATPPAPGMYELDPASFYVAAGKFRDQLGVLSLREIPVLRPLSGIQKAA